ncbi:MAG: DUF2442 domain-containing protein [Chlorobium limicola]|uniref:DUF2442 domain-containing protein n=1 Tax=Chlorobium limicola TaxID=1092 RepID=UPI0023F2FCD1|nr:DUF2442 domain-containing protein [Chlorobium limicola]NTV21400.1 DUF2442 domain-containing protein [Chlorobium limicola]
MRIAEIHPQPDWVLSIIAEDGRIGCFDVTPYLEYEAFEELRDHNEFMKVSNGGYFIEWACGADLSADTIEARWEVIGKAASTTTA